MGLWESQQNRIVKAEVVVVGTGVQEASGRERMAAQN